MCKLSSTSQQVDAVNGQQTWETKMIEAGLFVACFTLPLLPPNLHGKITLLIVLIWLFSVRKIGFKPIKMNAGLIIVAAAMALAIIECIDFLVSKKQSPGLNLVECLLPVIAFSTVIFSLSDFSAHHVTVRSLKFFVGGVIVLNLLSLALMSYNLWDFRNLQSDFRLANDALVQIHPAFLSMYISISLFFLIENYFPLQVSDRSRVGWVLFSLLVFAVFLVWLNSRVGIFAFFLASAFYVFYKLKGRGRTVAVGALVLVVLLVLSFPFSRERFVLVPWSILNGQTYPTSHYQSDIRPIVVRKHIFEASADILKWPEVLYGYGTEGAKSELHRALISNGYPELAAADLNAHNEYLASLHRHGLMGLGLFLLLLGYPFYFALKHRSVLLAVFVILFATTALFENVLGSQKSASFFALLCPLLMLHAQQKGRCP